MPASSCFSAPEKSEILWSHLGALPANLTAVALDLAAEPLEALFDRGLERERPTACVWQGVSYYLTLDAVSRVLDFMAGSLAAGSTVGFDACSPTMLDEGAPLAPASRDVVRRDGGHQIQSPAGLAFS